MKKILVIGAGMGGLSAAIRLQNEGYEVEIFEKTQMPGGKMRQIKDSGYTFDVGPTLVMMPSVYREIFEIAGKNPQDYIPMIKLEPMYDVYFKGSPYRHYSVSGDLSELMRLFESKGEKNARGFIRYLNDIQERYLIALKYFITRPFRNKKDIYNPFMIWQALKLKTFGSADEMMSRYIPDSDLNRMFSFQTLYIGVSPKKGPSLYNIIPMIELFYGVWFIKGGMHTMAKQMEKLFLELGGRIHYHHSVDEILIENSKVRGIRVGKEVIEAPYVISDADFPYAITNLVKKDSDRGKYTQQKIDKMDYSCSCLVFYWGVEGKYEHLKTHTFIVSEDLDENLKAIFDGRILEDSSVYLHIPSNADPEMAPEGKSSFYLLIPVSELGVCDYDWDDDTISYYREKALKTLSAILGLEDLKEKIELEYVFTPKDFQEHFNAYRGATFGLQPTLFQSNHFRPQSKSETCEGLYFTGSSTHPGAGVPIALEGGRICANELLLDERGKNAQ